MMPPRRRGLRGRQVVKESHGASLDRPPWCRKRINRAPRGTRSAPHAHGRETGWVDVTDLDADPLRQLATWLNAARAAGQPMPEAMTIASATSDAVPSARLVVLRGLRRGLVFFTDCESDKGAELAANPRAAAVLHWLVPAHRQVRVAGGATGERGRSGPVLEHAWPRRPSQRGRLTAKPRRRQPDGPGNAGPGHPAAPPRRSRCPRPRRWSGFGVLPSRVEFWREPPDGLTTGSATAGKAAAGSSSGCRRNDRQPQQPEGHHHQAALPVTCCHGPRNAEPSAALRNAPDRRFRAADSWDYQAGGGAQIIRFGAAHRPRDRRIISPAFWRIPKAAFTGVNARPITAASRDLTTYLP